MNKHEKEPAGHAEMHMGSEGQEYDGQHHGEYDAEHGGQEYDQEHDINLAESKQARKRAEEDVKLLANRIQLLKLEEKKAHKKIEETKKKAKSIMQVRQRNNDIQRQKDKVSMVKQDEERRRHERNQMMRAQMKDNLEQQRVHHYTKVKAEADRVKEEKQTQREMIEMQRQQEQLKNASMKQMIKNQECDVQERKRREQEEKRLKMRQDLIEKIHIENHKRIQIESEVSAMEEEELQLIQKLQNTQLLQKEAYEELERAIAGDEEGSQESPDKQRPATSGGSSQKKTPVRA